MIRKWRVEEESMKIGLHKDSMLYSSRRIVGTNPIATRWR